MLDPSWEIAGAGERVTPSCTKAAGSTATLARIARKPSGPPVPAMSSDDSNATRRPSPLIEGLMLIAFSGVFVTRRSGDWVRALCHAAAPTAAAARNTQLSLRYRR